jgi:hypothetical protein
MGLKLHNGGLNMEQQVTPADRMYVNEIVKLAQERLNMTITDLTNGEVNLDAELATELQQQQAKRKDLFDKGMEVLIRFGLTP